MLPNLLSEVQLSSASRNALQISFDNWTPTTSKDTIPTAYQIQWRSMDILEWLHYLGIGHSAIVHNYTISIENLEPDSLYLVRIVPLVEDGKVIYYGIPTPVYGPFSTRSYGKQGHGYALQWRHNGRDGVSNHQLHDCLLNRLDQRKHKSSASLAFVRGIHRW